MTVSPSRRRGVSLLAGVVAAALLLTACAGTPETEDASATPSEETTRVVSTEQGEVTIPASPERVVVVNANLTGYLYALDIPVHASFSESNANDSEYPSWAEYAEEDDTTLLSWSPDGLPLEEILAEAPDLIIGGGQGLPAGQARDAYEELTQIAPTVLLSADLLSWQDQLSFIADVFDVPDRESELLDAYKERVEEISASIALPENPVVYLMLLADGSPFLLPEDSQLPQTLADLGFEPDTVVADHPDYVDAAFGTGDSIELSREQITQAFTAPTLFYLGWNGVVPEADALTGDPIYSTLPAVVGSNSFELPYWAYRADYLRTLALLDLVEGEFS